MTSGEFDAVPLSSISIDRPNRQRRELTGIPELADSIKRLGLIHAPVITRERQLVSGERRLAAIKSLGWDTVVVQYADTLEPDALHAIELEENIKRLDLTWQERTKAIDDYHQLQLKTNPDWTPTNTAEALGVTFGHVYRHLSVAKEMKKNPKVGEASAFSSANNMVQRINERRASVELAQVTGIAEIERPKFIEQADFTAWAEDYRGSKFNLLHCDFPYGINMDKTSQGTHHEVMGTYKDTPEIYFKLLETLVNAQDELLADSCHIMFWFHMKYYDRTIALLESCLFDINPIPLIWHKTDNTGILSDPNRRPRHIYETALLGSRGDRKLVKPKSDVIGYATEANTFHISNKPLPVLRHFLEMLVDDTTVMLDPTAGSGGAVKVSKQLGARHVLGLEINPEFVDRANEWMNQ